MGFEESSKGVQYPWRCLFSPGDLMHCTGSAFGRFVVWEQTGELMFSVRNKIGHEVICFYIECRDLATVRSLIGAIGEDVQVSFEVLSRNKIRILQAVRRPEEIVQNLDLSLYVSKDAWIAYNSGGKLSGAYLLNDEFLDEQLWKYADIDFGCQDNLDKYKLTDDDADEIGSRLGELSFSIKLPVDYATVFKSDPSSLQGMVIQPLGGRFVFEKGKTLAMEMGMELITTPIRQFAAQSEKHALPEAARFERKVPPALRKKVLLRDGHRCVDCGANPATDPFVTLEVDHRVPVSKGGTNDLTNLQTLCWACNRGKGMQMDHKLGDDPWAVRPD